MFPTLPPPFSLMSVRLREVLSKLTLLLAVSQGESEVYGLQS